MVDHGLQKPTRRGSGIFEPPFLSPGTYAAFGVKKSLGRETRVREWGNPHVSTGKSARAIYRPKRIKKISTPRTIRKNSHHHKKDRNLLMTW